MNEPEVAVLGAGSWGTALALLARRNGHAVALWARDGELAREINEECENRRYLSGARLDGVEASPNLEHVVSGAEFIVSAVPCAGVPEVAREVARVKSAAAIVVSGTKGLHPTNGARGAEMWRAAGVEDECYVALSGPNLAREIVSGVPTSSVVASTHPQAAKRAQELFNSPLFRLYTNTDLLGVELGGAFKNVVAIAAGIGDARGFGDNAKAALMTRHWREMTRLAVILGAHERTLFGLSGIGDLVATCASEQSRNHRLGVALGGGATLEQAQAVIGQTTEGVHSTRAALALAEAVGIEMPVTQQLALVLFENRPVGEAITALMSRQERDERED